MPKFGHSLGHSPQAEPHAIRVAIETSHGPVVDALIDRGFRVYAINPGRLDRFSDCCSMAGAKDDTEVSEFLCVRLVQSHPRLGERL